jgi:hypothetical protein
MALKMSLGSSGTLKPTDLGIEVGANKVLITICFLNQGRGNT